MFWSNLVKHLTQPVPRRRHRPQQNITTHNPNLPRNHLFRFRPDQRLRRNPLPFIPTWWTCKRAIFHSIFSLACLRLIRPLIQLHWTRLIWNIMLMCCKKVSLWFYRPIKWKRKCILLVIFLTSISTIYFQVKSIIIDRLTDLSKISTRTIHAHTCL